MYRITMRFYEELNDFLPAAVRKRDTKIAFPNRRSVKDLIESLGVPHTEVDLILVNGESVGFDYVVQDGERISVYPTFETLSVKNVTRLRPEPLREPRFVCDEHVGKLARLLRLLGFDVLFESLAKDAELVLLAERDGRILVTRDRRLLMQKGLSRGFFIRSTDPEAQLDEVLDKLDLRGACRPFTRCTMCNGALEKVTKGDSRFEAIRDRIPPRVLDWRDTYYHCAGCERVYWEGTHYARLAEKVRKAMGEF